MFKYLFWGGKGMKIWFVLFYATIILMVTQFISSYTNQDDRFLSVSIAYVFMLSLLSFMPIYLTMRTHSIWLRIIAGLLTVAITFVILILLWTLFMAGGANATPDSINGMSLFLGCVLLIVVGLNWFLTNRYRYKQQKYLLQRENK